MIKILFSIMLCGVLTANAAHAKSCTASDAEAAESAVDSLTSWAAVNQNQIKFGHCDEGDIAEGNSEVIARLLAEHWDSLAELNKEIDKNPSFKRYVLRHIDATLDTDDLRKIETQSSHSCPAKQKALCDEINAAAIKAAQE